MRISDWSSDVCSSDLLGEKGFRVVRFGNKAGNVVALSDPDLCPCIPEGADHNRTLRHVETSSDCPGFERPLSGRSEEHTSELQSLMRNSYAVFCLKKKIQY